MGPIPAFVLGLLIGWLVEWLIDWTYWRRRYTRLERSWKQGAQRSQTQEDELLAQTHRAAEAVEKAARLDVELVSLRAELDHCRSQLQEMERHAKRLTPVEIDAVETAPAPPPVPDDLKVIKGIGPVISKMLNEAGITTFEQLGALDVTRLRAILGDMIERLSDEESLLEQARQLAQRKQEGKR